MNLPFKEYESVFINQACKKKLYQAVAVIG